LDKSDGRLVKFEERLGYFDPKLQPSPPVNGSFAVDSENRIAHTLFLNHIMKIVSLNLPVSVREFYPWDPVMFPKTLVDRPSHFHPVIVANVRYEHLVMRQWVFLLG